MPPLALLLSQITTEDKRLKIFTIAEANALLLKHPVLRTVLQYGWQEKSFKCVRMLGASSIVIGRLSGSSTSTSDSKAGWGLRQ
jgi:hypothetical protein